MITENYHTLMTILNSGYTPCLQDRDVHIILPQSTNPENRDIVTASYAPDVNLVYQQAACLLGANLIIHNLDDAIRHFSDLSKATNTGILVNLTLTFRNDQCYGLVPLLGSYIGRNVFPCDAKAFFIGEDKLVSKHLARGLQISCANTLAFDELKYFDRPVMEKPICSGDSIGIAKHSRWPSEQEIEPGYFIEEFIPGSDVTIHYLKDELGNYHFLEGKLRHNRNEDWYDGESKQDSDLLFSNFLAEDVIHISQSELSLDLNEKFKELLSLSGNSLFARVDLRLTDNALPITTENSKFLEINPAPTISNGNDWWLGIRSYLEKREMSAQLDFLDQAPVHNAAKSLAVLYELLYTQSLSIHSNRPVS